MQISGELLSWAVGIIISVIVLIVALNEIIVRAEQRSSVYTRFWRRLRDLVLPLVITFVIFRQMIQIDATTTGARLLETAIWLVVAYTVGSLLSAVGKAASDQSRLEASIPALFRGLLRIVAVGVPLYYVLSSVWGVALDNLFAALGVGSLVIALALQDTLSSVVSGFLLTLDRPFDVGDEIHAAAYEGEVIELNWRSVRMLTKGRDIIVIPNSALASQVIHNYTTRDSSYRDKIVMSFSYDDYPNKCKEVLIEAALSCPFVLRDPMPTAYLNNFSDSSIEYELFFFVDEFHSYLRTLQVRSDIRTQIYYAAQREGLTIPYPILMRGDHVSKAPTKATIRETIDEHIHKNDLLNSLPQSTLSYLGEHARLHTYGAGSILLPNGIPSDGLYLILSGEADMIVSAGLNVRLVEGDICGEMVFWGSRANVNQVQCVTDVEVAHISAAAVNEVLRQQPRFASSLDKLISQRLHSHSSYTSNGKQTHSLFNK